MAVRVNTTEYVLAHGRKPRQPRFHAVSGWAFEIDNQEPPLFICATYQTALKQAKKLAQHTVTVLP